MGVDAYTEAKGAYSEGLRLNDIMFGQFRELGFLVFLSFASC